LTRRSGGPTGVQLDHHGSQGSFSTPISWIKSATNNSRYFAHYVGDRYSLSLKLTWLLHQIKINTNAEALYDEQYEKLEAEEVVEKLTRYEGYIGGSGAHAEESAIWGDRIQDRVYCAIRYWVLQCPKEGTD
jgi:hypothetical protein